MDNLEEVDDDDPDDQEGDTTQGTYELWPNWMILLKMMPNRQGCDHDLADFGTWDIDRDHDWINESQLRYPEIEEAESFI